MLCPLHYHKSLVDLDQILVTDDVGDSLLAQPYPELVFGKLAFLRDPETFAIARHIKSVHCSLH
jgi:hypothetical protein